MKPLIFEFLEECDMAAPDFSMIEYNENLNLSIDKNTGKPAINSLMLATKTITNVSIEDSDSDRNNEISFLMATKTRTFSNEEVSDDDNDRSVKLNFLMGTMTRTAASECSDKD